MSYRKLGGLKFDNTYRRLPGEFYQTVNPEGFQNPHMVAFNPDAAELIDLDPGEALRPEFVEYFSGGKILPGSEPLAMYYTGHQFGVYNPDIGDGRAILLGEVRKQKRARSGTYILKARAAPDIRAYSTEGRFSALPYESTFALRLCTAWEYPRPGRYALWGATRKWSARPPRGAR